MPDKEWEKWRTESETGECEGCGTENISVREYRGRKDSVSRPKPDLQLCYLCSKTADITDPVLTHINFVGNTVMQSLLRGFWARKAKESA